MLRRRFPTISFPAQLAICALALGCSGEGSDPAALPAAGSGQPAAAEAAGEPGPGAPQPQRIEPLRPDAASSGGPAVGEANGGPADQGVAGLGITGRILDPDGRPLADARVHLVSAKAARPLPEDFAVSTAEEGRFTMQLPASLRGRRVDVVATAPGLQREGLRNLELEPGMEPLEIALRTGRSISGRVRDTANKPVAGAVVVATSGEPREPGVTTGSPAEMLPLRLGTPWVAWTTTDAEGGFQLPGLRLEAYHLYLLSDRYYGGSHGVVLPGAPPAEIVAQEGDRVALSVQVEGGAPAYPLRGDLAVWHADRIGTAATSAGLSWSGAPVAILLPTGEPRSYPRRFRLTLRDAAGRIGRAAGVIAAPGHQATQPVTLVDDGRVAVEFVPQPGAQAPGMVRLFHRVAVAADDLGAESNTVVAREVADGRVGSRYPVRLPADELQLRVVPLVPTPTPVEFAGTLDLTDARASALAEGPVRVGIEWPPSGTLRLDVSALAEEDRSDLLVVTGPDGGTLQAAVDWNGEGRATWPFCPPGTWRVTLHSRSGPQANREVELPAGGEATIKW